MIKAELKKVRKRGTGWVVTYPVSYKYNGGIIIDGEWHEGFEVSPPDIPEGHELVGIGVGLNLNVHPPQATAVLKPK